MMGMLKETIAVEKIVDAVDAAAVEATKFEWERIENWNFWTVHLVHHDDYDKSNCFDKPCRFSNQCDIHGEGLLSRT
jgi:hypothetical protein